MTIYKTNQDYQNPFSFKTFNLFRVLILVYIVLLSCNVKTTSFEGQWKCPEKNWKVIISKVDKQTYNVKWFYNLPTETLDEKSSGTYTSGYNTNVISYNGYEFKLSEDGRIYETDQAVFFTKE